MRFCLSAALGLVLSLATTGGWSEVDDSGGEVMNHAVESAVLQKFRDCLSKGDLDGLNLINRVSGGMPGESRIEEEVYISGQQRARVRSHRTGAPAEEAASDLSLAEVRALFDKIGKAVDSLVPRSEARFVPDSVVGSITIDVDGEQATFFYLVDEEDREAQEIPMEPEMSNALKDISNLSTKLRNAKED